MLGALRLCQASQRIQRAAEQMWSKRSPCCGRDGLPGQESRLEVADLPVQKAAGHASRVPVLLLVARLSRRTATKAYNKFKHQRPEYSIEIQRRRLSSVYIGNVDRSIA